MNAMKKELAQTLVVRVEFAELAVVELCCGTYTRNLQFTKTVG